LELEQTIQHKDTLHSHLESHKKQRKDEFAALQAAREEEKAEWERGKTLLSSG